MNVYEVTLKSLHYKHDISNTIFSMLNKVTHFIKKNLTSNQFKNGHICVAISNYRSSADRIEDLAWFLQQPS